MNTLAHKAPREQRLQQGSGSRTFPQQLVPEKDGPDVSKQDVGGGDPQPSWGQKILNDAAYVLPAVGVAGVEASLLQGEDVSSYLRVFQADIATATTNTPPSCGRRCFCQAVPLLHTFILEVRTESK